MVDEPSPLVYASQDQARTKLQCFQGQEARGSLQSSLKMGCPAPLCPGLCVPRESPLHQIPENSPGAGVKSQK